MRKILIAAVLLQFGNPEAAEPSSYLCVEEQATGLAFINKSWQQVRLGAGERYLLRRADKHKYSGERHYEWVVVEPGDKSLRAVCERDFDESRDGVMGCRGYGLFVYRFNRANLRFSVAFLGGFVYSTDETDSESAIPAVAIGKCRPTDQESAPLSPLPQ